MGGISVIGRNKGQGRLPGRGGVAMGIDGQKVRTGLPESRSSRNKCIEGRAWEYGVYRKWLESWSSGRA